MYAVINNSMGSGSVTYECGGHETRLSDCMSPPSSKIAPCYYALVKCFSKKSGGSTKITDKASGESATIVAGVVVSLLAVLLVVTIVIIILIVWLKRRDKNLKFKTADNNPSSQTSSTAVTADTEKTCLHDNPSYQYTTGFLSGTEAGNVILLQENPSYQPITVVSTGTKI